jgi:hypothetical protein
MTTSVRILTRWAPFLSQNIGHTTRGESKGSVTDEELIEKIWSVKKTFTLSPPAAPDQLVTLEDRKTETLPPILKLEERFLGKTTFKIMQKIKNN